MKPKWQKLASLAQNMCTLWFQFFGAVFASKGYPFKNIFVKYVALILRKEKYISGRIGLYFGDCGQKLINSKYLRAMANTFRELRYFRGLGR